MMGTPVTRMVATVGCAESIFQTGKPADNLFLCVTESVDRSQVASITQNVFMKCLHIPEQSPYQSLSRGCGEWKYFI